MQVINGRCLIQHLRLSVVSEDYETHIVQFTNLAEDGILQTAVLLPTHRNIIIPRRSSADPHWA